MSKRRYPLLRAVAELVNAANGVQPIAREGYITIPVFAFGWPTSEMSPLYMGGSMLDALRRGLRGDFRGGRGRIALLLTAIAWALLWLIHRRNAASQPHFEEPLREALGDDYEQIANRSQPARRRRTGSVFSQRVDPPALRREDQHRAVRPTSQGELRRHLAPRRPAPRRQGTGAAAGARRRLGNRHAASPRHIRC